MPGFADPIPFENSINLVSHLTAIFEPTETEEHANRWAVLEQSAKNVAQMMAARSLVMGRTLNGPTPRSCSLFCRWQASRANL